MSAGGQVALTLFILALVGGAGYYYYYYVHMKNANAFARANNGIEKDIQGNPLRQPLV